MAENEGTMIPGEEPKGEEAIQELAQEMGWKDEDSYEGDPETWVDAATFIKRGGDIQRSMQQHIKEQKKQLSDLRAGLEDLRKHNERVYKSEVSKLKNQIDSLTKQRREAIEEADPDRVEEIDRELEEMKSVISETEQMAANSSKKPESTDNPDFDEWRSQNDWYGKDDELTQYADAQADNPDFKGLPYKRFLEKIEEKTKAMFPDKFKGAVGGGKRPNNPVEGGHARTGGRGKQKFTRADLSDDHKQIMDRFVRTGALTEEQYIADLVEMGELK